VLERLFELPARAHDEGAVPGDRLVQRAARDEPNCVFDIQMTYI